MEQQTASEIPAASFPLDLIAIPIILLTLFIWENSIRRLVHRWTGYEIPPIPFGGVIFCFFIFMFVRAYFGALNSLLE